MSRSQTIRTHRASTFSAKARPVVAVKRSAIHSYGPRIKHQEAIAIEAKSASAAVPVTAAVPPSAKVQIIAPQPFAAPAHPKQQQSKVLRRQGLKRPLFTAPDPEPIKRGKLKTALMGYLGILG